MTVGVSPGTYTMQLGAPFPFCPPDEPGWYITPPFPPVSFPAEIGPPSVGRFWDPYATASKLRGTGFGQSGLDYTVLGLMLGGVATAAILVSIFAAGYKHRR